MSAYLIAHINVNDPDQWQIYVASVGATLEAFEAEVIFRGKRAAVLAGEHNYETVAVSKFPDEASVVNWFNSAAYQTLTGTRNQAAEVVFISYNE